MTRVRLACAVPAFCLALVALAAPSLAQEEPADPAPAASRRGTRAARPEGTRSRSTRSRAPAKETAKPAPASAPGGGQATLVATFNDWSTYTAQTGKAKICYALSLPKARQPANLKDTPAYLFVSFRPAENVKNEVAAVLGFPTKDGGAADLAVGSTKYPLVTKGANAWVKNPAEEPQVIATMSKGQSMIVQVTSARGNKTNDRYSLAGFAPALDRARKECP